MRFRGLLEVVYVSCIEYSTWDFSVFFVDVLVGDVKAGSRTLVYTWAFGACRLGLRM